VPLGVSPRRGGKEPLVVIVVFGDFQCPYTRVGEEQIKELLVTYGDDLAVVWKDLLVDVHPVAEPAARVARLARAELGDAGFWRVYDRLFLACADSDREQIVRAAVDVGLLAAKVRAALDGATPDAVERDNTLAFDLGDFEIPAYFINGRRLTGAETLAASRPLIEEELAKARTLLDAGVPRARVYETLQQGAQEGRPRERRRIDVPEGGPVLVGAHAILDVHQFGDEADYFTGLAQRVVDDLLREYGDRIRFHWHSVPEPSSAQSFRIAMLSDGVYKQTGNGAFWKFHRLLLENLEWPFKEASHPNPRGLGDDALVDYAREAGASTIYFPALLKETPKPARWDDARRASAAMHAFLYSEGYTFGMYWRKARQILDALLAEKAAASRR
jgi:protein-disulfide isomerase